MNDIIYVVEDEYTGNYTGFYDRSEAIKYIAKMYFENGFCGLYDTIVIDAEHNARENIIVSLDQIKDDLETLFDSGYIDNVAYIHEVEMKG